MVYRPIIASFIIILPNNWLPDLHDQNLIIISGINEETL